MAASRYLPGPESAIRRVVLAASPSWPVPGSAVSAVTTQWRRELMGPNGATLIVQAGVTGTARTLAGLWAKSGAPVEYAPRLADEVATADLLIAFCAHLDPAVRDCLDAATTAGVMASFDWYPRTDAAYPHPRPIPAGGESRGAA